MTNRKKAIELFETGVKVMYEGGLSTAIMFYEAAIGYDPNFYEALGNLGLCYMQMGELHKGISYLEKALKINPKAYNLIKALKKRKN